MNLLQRTIKHIFNPDIPKDISDEETLRKLRALAIKATKDGQYTPDRLMLERKWSQCLFVFGALQKGHPMYNTLLRNNSAGLWNAFTEDKFSCFLHKPDQLPVIINDKFRTVPYLRVKGKVFSVIPKYITDIDTYFYNGVQFERKRIPIIIPYREVLWIKDRCEVERLIDLPLEKSPTVLSQIKYQIVHIWTHVGISEYWRDRMDHGYNTGTISTFEPTQLKRYWKILSGNTKGLWTK